MANFEEVKKILEPICHQRAMTFATKVNQISTMTEEMSSNLAKEICQLFEPKPDSGRLLKEEQIKDASGHLSNPASKLRANLKAQRDLTASILKAQEQVRIEEIFKEIEENWSAINYHSPEAGRELVNSIDVETWQALKRRWIK